MDLKWDPNDRPNCSRMQVGGGFGPPQVTILQPLQLTASIISLNSNPHDSIKVEGANFFVCHCRYLGAGWWFRICYLQLNIYYGIGFGPIPRCIGLIHWKYCGWGGCTTYSGFVCFYSRWLKVKCAEEECVNEVLANATMKTWPNLGSMVLDFAELI